MKQNVFFLLGRLAGSIKNGDDKKSLEILEQIIEKVSEMDINLPQDKRETL